MKVLIAAAIVVAASASAHAQPANALGKPLPTPNLGAGTVSVRVVAGAPQNLVIGTDVTLLVDDKPRVARTDSTGHAIFKDLPAHATVQAKVVDEDKKEIASDLFPLPDDTGVTVMLSTRPWTGGGGGGGGAPFAGGGQGMPEPRQISGEPRPEQSDPAGAYTVRLTYDDLKDPTPPVGVPVSLVGYRYDGTVSLVTINSDKEGRAQFTGLDKSGATSYFALAQLPRNGSVDRLFAQPAELDPQSGFRVLLSAEKRTSTAAAVDDLVRIEPGNAVPAGKVSVVVEGEFDPSAEVSLIDAKTKAVLAKGVPAQGPPDPTDVRSAAHFVVGKGTPAATLDVMVFGGAGTTMKPIEGVSVRVIPADSKGPVADLAAGKTPDSGKLRLPVAAAGKLKAVYTVNGREFTSEPFDLTNGGGILGIEAHWEDQGKVQVSFDLAPAGQTVYAETHVNGQLYHSLPFQQVEGHGTHISLFVLPTRILFTFSWTSQINDEYLLVGGKFVIYNNAWAPYVAGNDGLVVPLPKGFQSAQLDNHDQTDVAIVPQGFKLVRPVPPGQRQFHGQFALPVENGDVHWWLDLPFGALQSGLEIQQPDGVDVQVPTGAQGQSVPTERGRYFVLPQLNIEPGKSMVMTITGLPAQPAWTVWVPRIVGLSVLGLLGTGLFLGLRKRGVDPSRAERRAKLLDELVELEKTGKQDKRREAVLAELEQLWD